MHSCPASARRLRPVSFTPPPSVRQQIDKNHEEISRILSFVRNRNAPPDVAVVQADECDSDPVPLSARNTRKRTTRAASGTESSCASSPVAFAEATTAPFVFGDALDESKHVSFIKDAKQQQWQHFVSASSPADDANKQQQQHQQQEYQLRRRSSNCAAPSSEKIAAVVRRKSLAASESHLLQQRLAAEQQDRTRMTDLVSMQMRGFCRKADAVLSVALAGVPRGAARPGETELDDSDSDTPEEINEKLKQRQQRDGLLFSSLLEGTRPFELSRGTALLPSYAVLHPIDEWKVCDWQSDDFPRELLSYFVA